MSSATVPLLDDDTVPFGEEESLDGAPQKQYRHPYITFFHLFFRGTSVGVYILCGWFSDSFITSFVCVVLLLSADFWTVKNLSGRFLVGMRWWNFVDDDGVSHWVFESKKNTQVSRVNPHEARIFWLALILFPIIWVVFFIIALFGLKFKWLLLVLIALALNGANLYGYVKCNFGANKNISSVTTDFVRTQVLKSAFDMMSKPAQQPTTAKPTGVI